nr:hypothetical protein [Tanacetum cinerariifolium]
MTGSRNLKGLPLLIQIGIIHVELEYNIEECYKAVTDQSEWNNPEGKEYLFDRSKPLPLIMNQGRQVIHVDYFINNDLEYLRGGISRKKYTTFMTKTKAAKYDILAIENMVPSIWSPVKRIITVTKLKVMKWYDYGYLEEIEVRREDQQLYKFKEGDFPRLHLPDHDARPIFCLSYSIFSLAINPSSVYGILLEMSELNVSSLVILSFFRTYAKKSIGVLISSSKEKGGVEGLSGFLNQSCFGASLTLD